MEPQPIESAPRDGTTILTEHGFARYLDQKRWGSPVKHGEWAECSPDGRIYECADDGPWYCSPKWWTPVPTWINEGEPQ